MGRCTESRRRARRPDTSSFDAQTDKPPVGYGPSSSVNQIMSGGRKEYMVIIGTRIGLPGERSLEKFQKACRHCRPLVLGCSLTHAIFNTIAPLLLFPRPHTSFSLYGCHQEQHQPSDMAAPSTSANIIERCQPADQCLRHLQSYIGDSGIMIGPR